MTQHTAALRTPMRDRLIIRVAGLLLQLCTKPTRLRLASALRPAPIPIDEDAERLP